MRQADLFIIPRRPWNAGRLIGPKAPLMPKHILAIREQLKVARRVRDLAMFNCALDAKLGAWRSHPKAYFSASVPCPLL